MAPRFPDPQWFLALGGLMAARGELFQRIGYVEARFVVRVLPDEDGGGGQEQNTGVAMQGYALTDAARACSRRGRVIRSGFRDLCAARGVAANAG